MTDVQQAVPVAQSPASIWLSPICDETADHGEGRTWASPAPEATCEDCGLPWVKYVRADLTPTPDATQTREAEGVVRVPSEPTEAMKLAGQAVFDTGWPSVGKVWAAMLDARDGA